MSHRLRRGSSCIFGWIYDSQFKISSTECKPDYSFGYNWENVTELISEAVFRSGRFAEVDGLPFFILQIRGGVYQRMFR